MSGSENQDNNDGQGDASVASEGAAVVAVSSVSVTELTITLQAAGFEIELGGEANVLDVAAGAIASLAEKLEKVTSDFEAARDAGARLQAKLDAADKAPRVRKGDQAKLRKVGPIEDQPDPRELLAVIREAGEVELVFAGNGREVALPPRIVSGDAWIITAVGLKLHLPELIVEGPGPQPLEIDGYGLFFGGKQVAYAARHDQLQLGAGRRMNLKDDVIFAG